ncbi:MAG: hypothetical protein JJT78_13190, partial [Leptospira sp.]|nr:hypothetical protein [Leptospira sp.]
FSIRSIILLLKPETNFELIYEIINSAREIVASLNPSQLQVYDILICLRLHHLMLNPWLWPNKSTWVLADDSLLGRANKIRHLKNIYRYYKDKLESERNFQKNVNEGEE